MEKKDKFLEAWKTSIATVRDVMADHFHDPEFHLDHDSNDAKSVLSFIINHHHVDTLLEAEPNGKEAFVAMFNDLSGQGRSDLGKMNRKFGALVRPVLEVLHDEILLKRGLDCNYFRDFNYPLVRG